MKLPSNGDWELTNDTEMGTKDIETNPGELSVPFIKGEDHFFKSEVAELVMLNELSECVIDDRSISSKISSADDTIVVFGAITTSIEVPMTTTFFVIDNQTSSTLKESCADTGIIKVKQDGVELIVGTNNYLLKVESPFLLIVQWQWINDGGNVLLDMADS
jgi:hypothetical protein